MFLLRLMKAILWFFIAPIVLVFRVGFAVLVGAISTAIAAVAVSGILILVMYAVSKYGYK